MPDYVFNVMKRIVWPSRRSDSRPLSVDCLPIMLSMSTLGPHPYRYAPDPGPDRARNSRAKEAISAT